MASRSAARATGILRLLAVALCAAACEDPAGNRGRSCTADADCGSDDCVADPADPPEDLQGWALTCDVAAGEGEVGAPCADAGDCDRGLCALAGACVAACATDDDCDAGLCQRVFTRGAQSSAHPVMACSPRVSLPADARIEITTLQDALGGDGLVDDEVTLPAAEHPTLLSLRHLGEPQWPATVCRPPLCVRSLRALDDGALLFDRDALLRPGAAAPINPVGNLETVDPALIYLGNGSTPVWSELGYQAALRSETAGDIELTALSRSAVGNRLDLNLFYVGQGALAPGGDRGPAVVAEAIEVLDDIYAQADIFIGEVRQLAIEGALLERGATFERSGDPGAGLARLRVRFGTWMELPALLRLSAGADNPGVNIFFVEHIESKGGGVVTALAGGTPGAMGMQGTAASGIAVATESIAGAAGLGRTLAHEIGHFLGLLHTSESDGTVWDPLDDTAECRRDRDTDGDGVLSAPECEGAGADNLMFWARTESTVLTPEQRRILAQAPLLQ